MAMSIVSGASAEAMGPGAGPGGVARRARLGAVVVGLGLARALGQDDVVAARRVARLVDDVVALGRAAHLVGAVLDGGDVDVGDPADHDAGDAALLADDPAGPRRDPCGVGAPVDGGGDGRVVEQREADAVAGAYGVERGRVDVDGTRALTALGVERSRGRPEPG